MTNTQWLVLIGNVAIVAFQSYLFRWQRSALMFARRMHAEHGTQFL